MYVYVQSMYVCIQLAVSLSVCIVLLSFFPFLMQRSRRWAIYVGHGGLSSVYSIEIGRFCSRFGIL
jgi:hypothetical protein